MHTILFLDQQLFLLINHLPHSVLLDGLARTFSGIGRFGLIWFLLGVWVFFREEKRDHWFYLPFLCTALIASVIPNVVLKPLVARLRPVWLPGAYIVASTADPYSFPSGHATFSFAMAAFLAGYERRWKWGLYILAALISFSRIYLGVHYPLDVIAGAGMGWGIGTVPLMLNESFRSLQPPRRRSRRK